MYYVIRLSLISDNYILKGIYIFFKILKDNSQIIVVIIMVFRFTITLN